MFGFIAWAAFVPACPQSCLICCPHLWFSFFSSSSSSSFFKHPFSRIIGAAFASVLHILPLWSTPLSGRKRVHMCPFQKLFHCGSIWKGQQRQKGQEGLTYCRLMMISLWTDKILCVCVCSWEGGGGGGCSSLQAKFVFFSSSCASNKYRGPFSPWVIFAGHEISLLDDTKLKGPLSHIFLELVSDPRKTPHSGFTPARLPLHHMMAQLHQL